MINEAGLNLIKHFEGLKLNAYQDQIGVWTIGYGHTGPDVRKGNHVSEAQADALLQKDLIHFCNGVEAQLYEPANENQFAALVSFAFNLGLNNLSRSTLLSEFNAGRPLNAAAEFTKWANAGGRHDAGLAIRRLAEQKLFLTPEEVVVA